ncbi:MAG: ABC transporter substrate-binding protein [Thermodesulfobacteriota bacterium]|nr:ABC transporter substrate-binding protein [Thermodesulfobacteriota bacterium]
MARKRMVIGFLVPMIVLFWEASGYAEEVRGVTDDTIKMGLITALTGPVANDMHPVYNSMKTYYKYINDSGGINGRKVKIIAEDDRYVVPAGIAAFKKLVSRDKVLYIQGPSGSSIMVALMRQAEKEKVPIISMTAGDKLVEPYKRYTFSLGSVYSDHQAVVFDYLMNDLKLKNPRIAIVYPDTDYGKLARDGARESAKRHGMKMVTEEVLNMGDVDATSVIMSLMRKKPDYVIHQGITPTCIVFFKDSKKYKFKTNFIGTAAAVSEDAIEWFKRSDMKTYFGNHLVSAWYDDCPGSAKMREITLRYNPGTERQYASLYTRMYTAGWVISNVFFEGLKRAGRNLNAETLADALETFRDVDFGGISPPMTFTSKSHRPHRSSRMYKADVDKEKFIPITEWRQP